MKSRTISASPNASPTSSVASSCPTLEVATCRANFLVPDATLAPVRRARELVPPLAPAPMRWSISSSWLCFAMCLQTPTTPRKAWSARRRSLQGAVRGGRSLT